MLNAYVQTDGEREGRRGGELCFCEAWHQLNLFTSLTHMQGTYIESIKCFVITEQSNGKTMEPD